MKLLLFSAKRYDQISFELEHQTHALDYKFEIEYYPYPLTNKNTQIAAGYPAICVFVNDQLDANVLTKLHAQGVRFILLRCSGFNNVDLVTAQHLKLQIARVPAYSPHAVAEHATALLLSLNRKIHKAYNRVREGNFKLEGLEGFDLYQKTVGIIGGGKIGKCFAQIMLGFGCKVQIYDPFPSDTLKALPISFVSYETLLTSSNIISLHCPLNETTKHFINTESLSKMKKDVILINTSRGAILDTNAVIIALKSQKIAGLGIDVYEEEGPLFFEDHSNTIIQDDVFERLLTFPNVLITGHQGFLTHEALKNIAQTTLSNLNMLMHHEACPNLLF